MGKWNKDFVSAGRTHVIRCSSGNLRQLNACLLEIVFDGHFESGAAGEGPHWLLIAEKWNRPTGEWKRSLAQLERHCCMDQAAGENKTKGRGDAWEHRKGGGTEGSPVPRPTNVVSTVQRGFVGWRDGHRVIS